MKKITFFLTFTFLLLFQGCSQKQYYEPEKTKDLDIEIFDLSSDIIDINSDGATLKNSTYLSAKGQSLDKLEKGFKYLNENNGIVLSTNDKQQLSVKKDDKINLIEFEKNIISASIQGELIAIGFIDNSIALYDLETKKVVFKEYLKQSSINDTKITNPIFLNSLILFPTLDGKIVIVDKSKKAIYRTINIDPKSEINNITYLKAFGNTLIAATPKKIFSFVDGKIHLNSLNIKAVAVSKKNIFVATLEGEIIKYNQTLIKLDSKKFKFAKFYAMGYSDGLYALESQGFLIKIDKNFHKTEVFEFSFDEESKAINIGDKIYFKDSYINLK